MDGKVLYTKQRGEGRSDNWQDKGIMSMWLSLRIKDSMCRNVISHEVHGFWCYSIEIECLVFRYSSTMGSILT